MSVARDSANPTTVIRTSSSCHGLAALALCAAALCMTCLPLAGCRQSTSVGEAPAAAEKDKAARAAEGVTLKPEEVGKAGIVSAPAVANTHAPEATGYAVIITREAIA